MYGDGAAESIHNSTTGFISKGKITIAIETVDNRKSLEFYGITAAITKQNKEARKPFLRITLNNGQLRNKMPNS